MSVSSCGGGGDGITGAGRVAVIDVAAAGTFVVVVEDVEELVFLLLK